MARSISTKEAAVMLRAALKRHFPGVKFSVRYERYSMGSHINVSWTDGPTRKQVEALANGYSGSRFDASCDGRYYVDSWLLPNGDTVTATRNADGYHRGELIEAPVLGAELVSFHGSQPSCERTISAEFASRCDAAWLALTPDQQIDLLNHVDFPRWEERGYGYKLAWFSNAESVNV